MRWIASSVLIPALLGLLDAQTPFDPVKYPRFAAWFDAPRGPESLSCEARPIPPHLNFGFHFVSGYMGRLPLKGYEGSGHRFAILTRVTPDDSGKPSYFSQLFYMPTLPGKTAANVEMDGAFFIGEGGYRVDWLIADRAGQVCRKSWHVTAKLSRGDRELSTSLPPGGVGPLRYEPWTGVPEKRLEEFPVARRMTVLLHVAPLSMRRLKLHPYDQTMLLSSLLSLLQRTPFTEIKLVAFSLDQQKEIFRQENLDGEGWDRLVKAVTNLDLVTVPVSVLQHRTGHVDVLKGLIAEELKSERRADAVVFLGPAARQAEKLRFEDEEEAGKPDARFFYLQVKPEWNRGTEFPDVISNAVHALAGKTFHIYTPHDLFRAIRDLK